MITCPRCNGSRRFIPVFVRMVEGAPREKMRVDELDCPTCKGTGEVTAEHAERIARGRELRQQRIESGKGLREYAEEIGVLPSVLCDIENGRRDSFCPLPEEPTP